MARQVSIRDKDIISRSFRMLSSELNTQPLLDDMNWGNYFNVFSSATGDNRYINPVAQFSPATDPRYDRFQTSSEGGMGVMWKQLYDNNVNLVSITPGVAEFAGLLSFITNMFDPVSAIMSNKGRSPHFTFYIGQAASSIAFWPMQLLSIGLQFLQFLMDSPKNRFYTIKADMTSHIKKSTGVLNDIMIKLGYVDPVLPKRSQEQTDPLYGIWNGNTDAKKTALLNKMFNDVVYSDGTVDIFRLITRGARKHRYQLKTLADFDNSLAEGTTLTLSQKRNIIRTQMERATQDIANSPTIAGGSPTVETMAKYMDTVGAYRKDEGLYPEGQSAYLNENMYRDSNTTQYGNTPAPAVTVPDTTQTNPQMEQTTTGGTVQTPPTIPEGYSSATQGGASGPLDPTNPDQGSYPTPPTYQYRDTTLTESSWAGGVYDYLKTIFQEGTDVLTFRVEGQNGAVSDSYSNTAGPSPLADKFNTVVRQVHEFNFDIAGGNTGIGILDGVINMVKDGVTGLAAGTVMGNIPLALANNAYIRVPDHYLSSSASLHRETFEISSFCNYAHPYEEVMKIWVLFSLLWPLVAPVSTGGSSSTSPPLVKVFSQSRQITMTGMVESMRFEFGSGPTGWTRDRHPLNFKCTFSVVDLDPYISVPLNRNTSVFDATNPAALVKRMLTDDGPYNQLTSRLAGQTYLDTLLRYRRMSRMLTTTVVDMQSAFRADSVASMLSNNMVGDVLKMFSHPIER